MQTMSIIVAGGGIFCLICAFLNFLNLSYTTYLLTDRRVCIDNTLFHIRHEYDLPSYLKDFYGDFAFRQTWQPSNLWDICLISSTFYSQSANGMFVFFCSLSKKDIAIIKQAEVKIRLKYNAPAPDPRYPHRHDRGSWQLRQRKG